MLVGMIMYHLDSEAHVHPIVLFLKSRGWAVPAVQRNAYCPAPGGLEGPWDPGNSQPS